MKVSKVSVTLSRSIKMADFQYYKPEVMVEVSAEEGDTSTDLYARAHTEAENFIEYTIKQECASFGI